MAQLGVRRRRTLTAGDAAIPDKLYFRIGEVANLCGLPAYVLRFWEGEFPQLKPNKGGTGQRLYRQRDVRMVLRIKALLYEGGYTIPGARQVLAAEGQGRGPQLALGILESEGAQRADGSRLRQLREELEDLLQMLDGPPEAGMKKIHPIRAGRRVTAPPAVSRDLFE